MKVFGFSRPKTAVARGKVATGYSRVATHYLKVATWVAGIERGVATFESSSANVIACQAGKGKWADPYPIDSQIDLRQNPLLVSPASQGEKTDHRSSPVESFLDGGG